MSAGHVQPATSAPDRRNHIISLAALATILVAGLALRVYRLDDECVWLDESVSYPYLHVPTLGAHLDEVREHDPPMSPLYFTLQYHWVRVAGDSIVAVRWLSMMFGLASIALIYALGSVLYNRGAGLIAALCTAFSIPHVYYSQEIRMYALVLCLALMSMLTLVLALKTPRRRWWLLHVGCNALLLATHLFGGLLIVAQACYLLVIHAKHWRMWSAWGAIHAVMFVPFLIRIHQLRGGALDQAISLIPVPSFRWLLNTYCIYYTGVEPWGGRLPDGYWPVAVVLALIAGLALRSFKDKRDTESEPARWNAFVLLAIWYLLPPLLLYGLSFAVAPCFVERYTLYSSFALYLMLGGALASYRRPWWIAFVLIALAGGYLWAWKDVDRPFRLDYREAANVIDSTSHPGDPIVGWREVQASLLNPYARVPIGDRFVHVETVAEVLVALETATVHSQSAWTVVYDGPAGDPRRDLESGMRQRKLRYDRTEIGGLRNLYVYHVTR